MWTPWSAWSACSAPCGNGTTTRQRQCDGPGGEGCTQEPSAEKNTCNLGACATEWSDWGPCDASCYGAAPGSIVRGSQARARECAQTNEKSCASTTTELSRDCLKTCPIGCPTTNSFRECSGHGTCVRSPEKGCTQEATCRSFSLRRVPCVCVVWIGRIVSLRIKCFDETHYAIVFPAQRARVWLDGRVWTASH